MGLRIERSVWAGNVYTALYNCSRLHPCSSLSSLSGSVVRLHLRVFVGSHLAQQPGDSTHMPRGRLRKKKSRPSGALIGQAWWSQQRWRPIGCRTQPAHRRHGLALVSVVCGPQGRGAPRVGGSAPRRAWSRKDVVSPASVVSAVSLVWKSSGLWPFVAPERRDRTRRRRGPPQSQVALLEAERLGQSVQIWDSGLLCLSVLPLAWQGVEKAPRVSTKGRKEDMLLKQVNVNMTELQEWQAGLLVTPWEDDKPPPHIPIGSESGDLRQLISGLKGPHLNCPVR
nr:uncharacterized protein LOC127488096 [Oryctolagus cuniculus]